MVGQIDPHVCHWYLKVNIFYLDIIINKNYFNAVVLATIYLILTKSFRFRFLYA